MKHAGTIRTEGYKQVHQHLFRSEADLQGLKRQYIWPTSVIINKEEQMYDPRAVTIKKNALCLTYSKVGDQLKDNDNTEGTLNGKAVKQKHYSGVVTSHNQFSIGPFFMLTIRAKLAKGQGLWSALWLLAIRDKWPDQDMLDEFDIVEALGREEKDWYHVASHLLTRGAEQHWSESVNVKGLDIYNEFNDYTVQFEPSGIYVGINGQYNCKFPFPKKYLTHRWHWLANLAGGGDWAGKVDESILPAEMFVESVTFFQTNEHMDDEAVEEESGANNNISSGDPVKETPVPDPAEAENDPKPSLKNPDVIGSGHDFEFTVDKITKTIRWSAQAGAVEYKVFKNATYMTTVDSPDYRALRPGYYSFEGVNSKGQGLGRSMMVKVDVRGRR